MKRCWIGVQKFDKNDLSKIIKPRPKIDEA